MAATSHSVSTLVAGATRAPSAKSRDRHRLPNGYRNRLARTRLCHCRLAIPVSVPPATPERPLQTAALGIGHCPLWVGCRRRSSQRESPPTLLVAADQSMRCRRFRSGSSSISHHRSISCSRDLRRPSTALSSYSNTGSRSNKSSSSVLLATRRCLVSSLSCAPAHERSISFTTQLRVSCADNVRRHHPPGRGFNLNLDEGGALVKDGLFEIRPVGGSIGASSVLSMFIGLMPFRVRRVDRAYRYLKRPVRYLYLGLSLEVG